MRHLLSILIVIALMQAFTATPAQRPVRSEIDALLDRLSSSPCQFYRNGRWYSATEAKDHLQRKLKYMERKGTIKSTEEFIELGASSSSSTGKPYRVQCGSAAPIESRIWLSNELKLMRSSAKKAESRRQMKPPITPNEFSAVI